MQAKLSVNSTAIIVLRKCRFRSKLTCPPQELNLTAERRVKLRLGAGRGESGEAIACLTNHPIRRTRPSPPGVPNINFTRKATAIGAKLVLCYPFQFLIRLI